MKKIFAILGMQGSGKTTQAEYISKELGYKRIVMSDLLKKEAKKKTKKAKLINEIIKKGEFVPFEITCDLLFEKIKQTKTQKILIDGFPRMIEQSYVFDYFIHIQNYDFKGIIYIHIDKKEAVDRLTKRHRSDDTKKGIKTRIDLYEKQTKPVIEKYKKKKKIIDINGNKTKENVFKEIKQKVKNK